MRDFLAMAASHSLSRLVLHMARPTPASLCCLTLYPPAGMPFSQIFVYPNLPFKFTCHHLSEALYDYHQSKAAFLPLTSSA